MARADKSLVALDDLIEALNENAARVAQMLERANQLKAQREGGVSWSDIVADEPRPLIVEMLTRNIENLHETSARFRRAQARALRAEGRTLTEIAMLFGVTRQRVSVLLNSADAAPGSFGAYRR